MKDANDVKTAEILEAAKKRGRPALANGARTAAQRKEAQRERMETAIYETNDKEWTEAQCLFVLSSPKWKSTPIGQGAWVQLGKLRNYS